MSIEAVLPPLLLIDRPPGMDPPPLGLRWNDGSNGGVIIGGGGDLADICDCADADGGEPKGGSGGGGGGMSAIMAVVVDRIILGDVSPLLWLLLPLIFAVR